MSNTAEKPLGAFLPLLESPRREKKPVPIMAPNKPIPLRQRKISPPTNSTTRSLSSSSQYFPAVSRQTSSSSSLSAPFSASAAGTGAGVGVGAAGAVAGGGAAATVDEGRGNGEGGEGDEELPLETFRKFCLTQARIVAFSCLALVAFGFMGQPPIGGVKIVLYVGVMTSLFSQTYCGIAPAFTVPQGRRYKVLVWFGIILNFVGVISLLIALVIFVFYM